MNHLIVTVDPTKREVAKESFQALMDDPLSFGQMFWVPAEDPEQCRRDYNNLSLTAKVQFKKG